MSVKEGNATSPGVRDLRLYLVIASGEELNDHARTVFEFMPWVG